MTDLTPIAGWDPVRQLETNEPALGGAGGNMNEQAQALYNRTEQAKTELTQRYTKTEADARFIPLTQFGEAGGVATLEADGFITATQQRAASTTARGSIEIATSTEVNTGTDDERAVTPLKLLAGVKKHLNVSGKAPMYAARAFVTFNASTGTPVVSASGNVTSITDNGIGDFTINFTTAMPDANYAISGVTGNNNVTASPAAASIRAQTGAITTTSCRVRTANHFINSGAAAYDMPYNSVIIFR